VFPNEADESTLIWPGGMNLISFTRTGRPASNNLGWPEPVAVDYTSNLGSTWTFNLSNIYTGPCGVTPNTIWSDEFTHPSAFINPINPSQITMVFGERKSCTSGPTGIYWRTVTFNASSAFSGAGMNLPLSQVLNLNPGQVNFNHTSYSSAIPVGSNSMLMSWEEGDTTTTEDIYVEPLTYPCGICIGSGIRLGSGIKIH
jgi:hypothetical protein